ncbi:hypothetical protein MAMC_00255 [Methylacidimicrobium cyclopophantes]|uniref:Uncharacterized protein n=1 Tax=Methylacidimicrobium cyclopophantes TaxID=1041766 RepID=A0A5E6M7H8_9BACT|nr:hypothetical protein [Methylacidimicrobium cyclopophantes]VVM04881.1 hypothetical protein MAMC_00255 [Methylacidimicrobium cyclopophantes]
MKEEKGKSESFGEAKLEEQQLLGRKRRYLPPRLTVHGTLESITQNTGLLLTDTLLTGSTVSTVTLG